MRFLDYKCEDCGTVAEIIVMADDSDPVRCEKCGSTNMVRIFAPVGLKSSSPEPLSSQSSKNCSGSCANCSGCS